jgi:hypothetical protein
MRLSRVGYGVSSNIVCSASSCAGDGRLRVTASAAASDTAVSVDATVVAMLRIEDVDEWRPRAGMAADCGRREQGSSARNAGLARRTRLTWARPFDDAIR